MSKRKYARKKQHPQARTHQQGAEIGLDESKGVTSHRENPATTSPERESESKMNPTRLQKSWQWVRQESTFTNVMLTAFTGILSIIAVFQYLVTGGQLEVMQQDERAWLRFDAYSDAPGTDRVSTSITTGQPVTYPMKVANVGKTPARNMDMKIFVDIGDALQEPPLDHVDGGTISPHGHATAGIIFPNSEFKQSVVRLGDDGSPLVATDKEVVAIRDGKAYLAVYGVVTYDDVFNTHHWTKFCSWIAGNGKFEARQCTQYNSVDSNK